MTIAIPVPCEILGFGGFVRPKLGIGALETERFAPNECAVGMLVNLRGMTRLYDFRRSAMSRVRWATSPNLRPLSMATFLNFE
jgi:hypothetical protein